MVSVEATVDQILAYVTNISKRVSTDEELTLPPEDFIPGESFTEFPVLQDSVVNPTPPSASR